MIIEYFTVDSGWCDPIPEALQYNFADREKLVELILKEYKPSFPLGQVEKNLNFSFSPDNPSYKGVNLRDYQRNLEQFRNSKEYEEKTAGYYELIIGEQKPKIDGYLVGFEAELNIKFIEAELIRTPEIKCPGKPYQPKSIEVKIIKEFPVVPLYACGEHGSRDRINYSLISNISKWSKTTRATISNCLYIVENKIEIV